MYNRQCRTSSLGFSNIQARGGRSPLDNWIKNIMKGYLIFKKINIVSNYQEFVFSNLSPLDQNNVAKILMYEKVEYNFRNEFTPL